MTARSALRRDMGPHDSVVGADHGVGSSARAIQARSTLSCRPAIRAGLLRWDHLWVLEAASIGGQVA
jgi:hypothetical protein